MQQLLDSTITDVTVYLDRAEVSRMAQIELEPSEALLVFNDLPLSLDANSVQITGKGAFIIRDIQHATASINDEPLQEIKPLLEEKKAPSIRRVSLRSTDCTMTVESPTRIPAFTRAIALNTLAGVFTRHNKLVILAKIIKYDT